MKFNRRMRVKLPKFPFDVLVALKRIFQRLIAFIKELKVAFKLFSVWEKRIVVFALIIFLASSYIYFRAVYFYYTLPAPAFGGKLEETLVGAPSTLNPLFATSNTDRDFDSLVFSPLVTVDKQDKIMGVLAKSFEVSKDLQSYKITMFDNLFWQDGKELTSEDVEFTFNILINPLYKGVYRGVFEGVTLSVEGPKTFSFGLVSPQNDFLNSLQFGILPKHIYQNVPIAELKDLTNKEKIIGSGPYKVDRIDLKKSKIKKITLSNFSKYHIKKPYISKIVLSFNDETGAKESLEGSKFDSVVLPEKVKAPKKYNAIQFSEPSYIALFFNTQSAFKDVRLRQAISSTLDRQAILRASYGENAVLTNSPVLPNSMGFDKSIAGIEYNPKKTKGILASLGYKYQDEKWLKNKKPLNFQLVGISGKYSEKILLKIKDELEKTGISVKVSILDEGHLQSQIVKKNYDLILLGIDQSSSNDPYTVWHSSQIVGSGLNLSKFKNAQADLLLEEAKTTSDPEMKIRYLVRFQEIFNEELPALMLFQPYNYYFIDKKVRIDDSCIMSVMSRFCKVENWYIKTRRVRK